MEYIKRILKDPSFEQKGMKGYSYPLETKVLSMDIEDSYEGHERYVTMKESTCIYYVLEGKGIFCIDGKKQEVTVGDVVEIPAKTEFVFAGEMKLLLVMTPAFSTDGEIEGRENDLKA